jgi:hypothetical protein
LPASIPRTARASGPLAAATAAVTPLPAYRVLPSRSSHASKVPVDAPEPRDRSYSRALPQAT